MKKFLALFLAIVMCASFCACSNEPVEMNDAGFITNLTSALEARWKISSVQSSTDVSAYRDQLMKCVDAEFSILGNFSEYTFTDKNLAILAEEYYMALESQREGIQRQELYIIIKNSPSRDTSLMIGSFHFYLQGL